MEYKSSLYGLALFELKSWLGRKFLNSKPKFYDAENYLNLGCGSNSIAGYINADFFYRFKFWKEDVRQLQWQLDLRYPLNCPDQVFDGIYSEHTLEHLYPDDVQRLITELYRIMKKGSIIRITVPDLEKYVNFYSGEYAEISVEEFKIKHRSGCTAIRNMSQNYFHLSVWDFQELSYCLEAAGFKDIKKQAFSETANPKLNLDLKARAWETLYVEARK